MSDVIKAAENFVNDLLTNELNRDFLYHNLRHTQRVAKNTKELLDHYELKNGRAEIVLLAAWLHDTGYTKGVKNHEETSCSIAKNFLEQQNYPTSKIDDICKVILATKRYHVPQNLEEEIIRDADSSHLAKKSYTDTSELLRKELSLLGIAEFSQSAWRDINIKMFSSEHRFYTDYAMENWQKGKDDNLKKLIKEKKNEKKIAKKEELKAKFKNQSPDRGIQTIFRTTLRNHLTLSDIADTKANILLSVNAIIISLALANLIPKLDNPIHNYLIYPTVIFVVFSIISMIMAVLATRPNVTSGTFTKEDVNKKNVNILFFGNFHKMKLKDYDWAISEMLKDRDYIYSSLSKDLYYLGLVLNRKYQLLRWTYTIFIIGMIVSVIAFGVAFKYYGPERVLP